MKILLVVGSARDVFTYNMAKWLKREIPGLVIDVFEFYPSKNSIYGNEYFNIVGNYTKKWFSDVRGLHSLLTPFGAAHDFDAFLNDKTYDIIHCHWITSNVVLSHKLRSHCKKLYITFWGGEFKVQKIFHSKQMYYYKLRQLLANANGIVNSKEGKDKLCAFSPKMVDRYYPASLGSSSLDALYALMKVKTKVEVKRDLGFPDDKLSVMIGYSGKQLHQHLKVIEALQNRHKDLCDKIYLVAPMTRDGSTDYVNQVETALKASGFSYTLLQGGLLSDEKIAELRLSTDVVLQLSSFDGFSRSIVECLTARAVIIYGSWLNYKEHLNSNNYIAYKAESFTGAIDLLLDVVDCYPKYMNDIKSNDIPGYRYTWQECITDWVKLYKNA